MNMQNKKLCASLIRDKKEILFGKFSDNLTHENKVNEWKTISDTLSSQNILKDKNWKYVRDVLWQNMKRATMSKVDNAKKTGSGGGPSSKLNDLDCIIIDIVNKESPILQGIEEEASCLSPSSNNADGGLSAINPINNTEEELENIEKENHQKKKTTYSTKSTRKRQKNHAEDEEIIFLKRKRLLLEIYNLELDAKKKEKELGLPPSFLTGRDQGDGSSQSQDVRVLELSEF